MPTQTLTLTEFLLARIAENEAAAEEIHARDCYLFVPDHMQVDPPECDCSVPARVLAECEAKRRIVEASQNVWKDMAVSDPYEAAKVYEVVLPLLALPYADHPDYREEWKP